MKKIRLRIPHYYVPPCPNCGSACTGRYVRHPFVEAEYYEEKSLKNAEIVRFVAKEPVKNCFCVDCGHEWGKTIDISFITKDELKKEHELRGTMAAYEELHEQNVDKAKARRRNPFRRAFHWFFG